MSKDELVEELELQRVILSSLDQSVADREVAEAMVRAEIASLEHRLRDIRQREREAREATTKTPNSRSFGSFKSNPLAATSSSHSNTSPKRNPFHPPVYGGR